jgi:hypothetical protein
MLGVPIVRGVSIKKKKMAKKDVCVDRIHGSFQRFGMVQQHSSTIPDTTL